MTVALLDHHVGEQHDPRSRAYGIARLVAEPPPDRTIVWTRGRVKLDQHSTAHCGGFGSANEAQASPFRVPVDEAWAHGYYYEAKDRKLDPWGREDGTSTLAMLKVGQLRGLWDSYAWSFSMEDNHRAIRVGPFLAGLPWMTGMFTPDVDGIIRATGAEEGGHLVCVNGRLKNYRRKGPHWRIVQSWGEGHGRGGVVYLPEADLYDTQIARGGEVGIPVGRRLP